jgi:hypothetical protein
VLRVVGSRSASTSRRIADSSVNRTDDRRTLASYAMYDISAALKQLFRLSSYIDSPNPLFRSGINFGISHLLEAVML